MNLTLPTGRYIAENTGEKTLTVRPEFVDVEVVALVRDNKPVNLGVIGQVQNVSNSEPPALVYRADMKLADIQKFWVLEALKVTNTRKEAAQVLGCTIKTLYNKMHEYGVFKQYEINTPKAKK